MSEIKSYLLSPAKEYRKAGEEYISQREHFRLKQRMAHKANNFIQNINGLNSMFLCGSFATGKITKESDIDMCFVFDKSANEETKKLIDNFYFDSHDELNMKPDSKWKYELTTVEELELYQSLLSKKIELGYEVNNPLIFDALCRTSMIADSPIEILVSQKISEQRKTSLKLLHSQKNNFLSQLTYFSYEELIKLTKLDDKKFQSKKAVLSFLAKLSPAKFLSKISR